MRRSIDGLIAACIIDQNYRALYVEGARDKAFFDWLTYQDSPAPTVLILDEAIEVHEGNGGARGRLLSVAYSLESEGVQGFAYFVDADFDHILPPAHPRPNNGWITDDRDLEAYAATPECLMKIGILSLGFAKSEAITWVQSLDSVGRQLAYIRLGSQISQYKLPFQRTQLTKSLTLSGSIIELDESRYIQALISNAYQSGNTNPPSAEEIRDSADRAEAEHHAAPSVQIVHGKDLLELITLTSTKRKRKFSEDTLWSSLERSDVSNRPNLSMALSFLASSV